jgi:hypothetical protein
MQMICYKVAQEVRALFTRDSIQYFYYYIVFSPFFFLFLYSIYTYLCTTTRVFYTDYLTMQAIRRELFIASMLLATLAIALLFATSIFCLAWLCHQRDKATVDLLLPPKKPTLATRKPHLLHILRCRP